MSIRLRTIIPLLALAACGPSPAPATPGTGGGATGNVAPAPAIHVGCDTLAIDLYAGTVNGLAATASQAEVKATLPCSTGDDAEGGTMNHGGGVYFLDHDLFVYTGNDYVEARDGFAGAVTPPLLGAPPSAAAAELGAPALEAWDGARRFYDHAPGCISIHHDEVTIIAVSAHFRTCAEVQTMFEEG